MIRSESGITIWLLVTKILKRLKEMHPREAFGTLFVNLGAHSGDKVAVGLELYNLHLSNYVLE